MFVSILQAGCPDLKIQLPEKEDTREFPMELQGETIEQTLNHICATFGLVYRLAEDGTIVLSPVQRVAKGLIQRAYWLKAGAFSDTAKAQEELTAKGVPFPAGASAIWLPETQQLSVTNTAANMDKLAEVLAADFGGTLGSPTHWLLLTSGARLGFAVDKFEPDAIIGQHPLYGQCHVPMSQVYSITTAAPDQIAPLESLRDWRLVLAPEPVIPEAGGEGSPSLGKETKPFKLPLLGGGEFNLVRERGKIVVLDFWATWCGPCVKALPGLTKALSAFPPDRVKFIAVNQAEPTAHIKQFMETRSWNFPVALDADQDVAREYGVEGIPHTVIIGPDGKVAWVKTGYSPDGEKEAAEAVKKLLGGPAPPVPN
jgi:peroxiredoxin